jgi:preflagellin peptidase FlaK
LFLALGSIHDLRSREVPDQIWIVFGLIGICLTSYRVYSAPAGLAATVLSIILSATVALVMSYFGLFGGADAKAIICLSLSIPLFPEGFGTVFDYVLPFFPIAVMATGFLLTISVFVWLGLRNLGTILFTKSRIFEGFAAEPSWKKILAVLTGYPTSLTKLQSTFYLYPLEEVLEDSTGPRRSFRLFEKAEVDRDGLVRKLSASYSKVGFPNQVWVTPGLPMIPFFLAALILILILGDPIIARVILR